MIGSDLPSASKLVRRRNATKFRFDRSRRQTKVEFVTNMMQLSSYTQKENISTFEKL